MFYKGMRVWNPDRMTVGTVVNVEAEVVYVVFDANPMKVVLCPARRIEPRPDAEQTSTQAKSDQLAGWLETQRTHETATGAAFYDHGQMCHAIERVQTKATIAIQGPTVTTADYYREKLSEINQMCIEMSTRLALPKFFPDSARTGIVVYTPKPYASDNTSTQEG